MRENINITGKRGITMKGNLFVVSGPSGVGKGTLCKMLCEKDEKIFLSVSATTRAPREGEVNGVSYHFLTNEQFDEKVANDEFYEWARVHNNRYGTLKQTVQDKLNEGYDVLLEIDVQGGMNMKKQENDAILIFIAPPSEEVLRERLTGRQTETPEQIELRLKNAFGELEYKDRYDHIVINDDLTTALDELYALIVNERNS